MNVCAVSHRSDAWLHLSWCEMAFGPDRPEACRSQGCDTLGVSACIFSQLASRASHRESGGDWVCAPVDAAWLLFVDCCDSSMGRIN